MTALQKAHICLWLDKWIQLVARLLVCSVTVRGESLMGIKVKTVSQRVKKT